MRARITLTWVGSTSAHLVLGGGVDAEVLGRVENLLDLVLRAAGTDLVVDLSGIDGPDDALLDVLAEACRRLWLRRGSMRLVGLGDRLLVDVPSDAGRFARPEEHARIA